MFKIDKTIDGNYHAICLCPDGKEHREFTDLTKAINCLIDMAKTYMNTEITRKDIEYSEETIIPSTVFVVKKLPKK